MPLFFLLPCFLYPPSHADLSRKRGPQPFILILSLDIISGMRAKRRLQPGLQLALGFLGVITIGTLLLLLPISQNEGENLKAIDALFISTSAVCVTGLTPVDISVTLSPFGTTVMMLLIQIGGLGYAVIAVIIIRLTSGKLDLSSRNLLRDSFGADHRVRVWKLFFTAIAVTFTAELIGAILLFIGFSGHGYSLGRTIYLALFHSVSAFNNAGFDLFSTSLMSWNDSALVLVTIALLIVSGGLGFLLYTDLIALVTKRKKVSLHTKIVLSTTLLLIVTGTVLFYFILPDIDLKNAFFQSVTTRTAGYFSYDQTTLPPAGVILTIVLMFIGASPGSTGGGVKTTSIFTALKATFSLLLGRKTTAFRREISNESVMKAFFVIIISVLLLAVATLILSMTDPEFTSDKLLYEAVSAYATVGLTMGVTPYISFAGKIVLIILMFLGRVGFMTIISAFASRKSSQVNLIEEKIIIG